MKLEQSFEVAAPLDRVWRALIDVEQVAPCLPGATITGRNDDGSYSGAFTVKIGPTTASYTGKLEMESIDEQTHTATMSAQGSDKRGQGGATAKILSRLQEAGEGRTRVEVDTDYRITGRLARFGRGGMIEDISERLFREFAQRLQQLLEGGGGSGGEVVDETPPAPGQETPAPPGPASAEETPPAPESADGTPPAPESAEGTSPPAAEAKPPPVQNEPLQAAPVVGSVLFDRMRANPWAYFFTVFLIWRMLRRRKR